MRPARLAVRFPTASPIDDLEPAIALFHRFIQRGLVEGLLLDVADYRHVPTGPGVVLIGHDVDYALTDTSLTVRRLHSGSDTAAEQLRDALRMGLGAIAAIEDDGALELDMDRSRFAVSILDRRYGEPAAVESALRTEVAPFLTGLYGPAVALAADLGGDPRRPATIHVESDPDAAAAALARLGGAHAPGQSPWDISVEELARSLEAGEELILLDVREPSEFDTVNIGGRPVPLATLGDHLDALDRDARIVVHCRAGHRAAKAVGQLRDAGYADAWNLNGGLMTWIERIDPTLPTY